MKEDYVYEEEGNGNKKSVEKMERRKKGYGERRREESKYQCRFSKKIFFFVA